ncbi:46168_t:CDS:1, partial [Gigaspora margarita]
LKKLVKLTKLDIRNNKFSGSLEPFKDMVNLQELYVGNNRFDKGLEYLPTGLKIFDVCPSKYYENIQNGVQLSDELIDQEFGISRDLLKLGIPEKYNGF